MTLSFVHLLGIALVLVAVAAGGMYSGRNVATAADFTSGGGRAGPLVVAGTILGTLVGGQATVGTAQLAFSFGISAWWFTLGAGLGCLLLALLYVQSLRRSAHTTLAGVIETEYGRTVDYVASILSAVGIFISVLSQLISFGALATAVLPIPLLAASLLAVAVTAAYIIFGGVWGAGIGGIIKLILSYATAVTAGIVVLAVGGGIHGIAERLQSALVGTPLGSLNGVAHSANILHRYGSLVARGPLKDFGSCLSLILGVLSTQTYASAVWSAKSSAAARRGALLSAFLIPPIGAACILVGLFMRGTALTTAEVQALTAAGQPIPPGMIELASTAQVFPAFILRYLPKFAGGIALGTLLIAVVGGGAGLSLGVATIIVNDIICEYTHRFDSPKVKLTLTRAVIVLVLLISALIATALPSAIINDFGYLSMGLRGTVIFVPLCCALWLPGRIDRRWTLAAVVTGPLLVLGFGAWGRLPFDPLFLGMAATVAIMGAGLLAGHIYRRKRA